MPRLVNVGTGIVVSVSDEKASRMGSAWALLEPTPTPKKRGRPRKEPDHVVDDSE